MPTNDQSAGAMPVAGGAMPPQSYPFGPVWAPYRLPFPGANGVVTPREIGISFEGEAGATSDSSAGATGAGAASDAGSTSGSDAGSSATDDVALGEAGKATLQKIREELKAERDARRAAEKDRDELRTKGQTESEKAIADAKKAGADEVIGNRDYEGEISGAGSTVDINSIGRVTIGNYTKNTDIGAPETLTSSQKQLVIDQQKFFNFQVDDIDKAQTKPKVMAEAMKEAAFGLSDVEDLFLAGFHTGAAAANLIGNDVTPTSVTTPAQAYEFLVDLGVLLDEQSIPSDGRSAVIPAVVPRAPAEGRPVREERRRPVGAQERAGR
jgi:hypothetical protein